MTLKPTRVTTCGRGSNWGFRVLGSEGEVLASRWRFPSEQAARQAGIAASLAISPTSISIAHAASRIDRSIQKNPNPEKTRKNWRLLA